MLKIRLAAVALLAILVAAPAYGQCGAQLAGPPVGPQAASAWAGVQIPVHDPGIALAASQAACVASVQEEYAVTVARRRRFRLPLVARAYVSSPPNLYVAPMRRGQVRRAFRRMGLFGAGGCP